MLQQRTIQTPPNFDYSFCIFRYEIAESGQHSGVFYINYAAERGFSSTALLPRRKKGTPR